MTFIKRFHATPCSGINRFISVNRFIRVNKFLYFSFSYTISWDGSIHLQLFLYRASLLLFHQLKMLQYTRYTCMHYFKSFTWLTKAHLPVHCTQFRHETSESFEDSHIHYQYYLFFANDTCNWFHKFLQQQSKFNVNFPKISFGSILLFYVHACIEIYWLY